MASNTKCAIGLLVALCQPQVVLAQARPTTIVGEHIGGGFVTIGMPIDQAVKTLGTGYTVRPVSVAGGGFYLIYRDGAGEESVGSFTVKDGKVALIQQSWNPTADGASPFAAALMDILDRLATKKGDQWNTADDCFVSITPDVPLSPDQRVRIADIACGQRSVSIQLTRSSTGAAVAGLQLTTGTIP